MNEHVPNSSLPRNIWNVVKITLRINHSIVDRGRHNTVANGKTSRDHLNRTARSQGLTAHRFERGDWDVPGLSTKRPFYPSGLSRIIVNHGISVRTDVVDIERQQLGILHRERHAAGDRRTAFVNLSEIASVGSAALA